MKDITSQMFLGKVEDFQIMHVIQNHFNRSQYTSRKRMDFPDFDTAQLVAHFSNEGNLKSIESSLEDDKIEEMILKLENIYSSEEIVTQDSSVQFSSRQIMGKFECAYFSIFEMEANAPKPPVALGDYPFRFGFPFLAIDNSGIDFLRRIKTRQELLLVLGLLTFDIKVPNNHAVFNWGIEVDRAGSIEVNPESKWFQKVYLFESKMTEDERTTHEMTLQPILLEGRDDYFSLKSRGFGNSLTLPSNLPELFSNYFALKRDVQKRFLRAAFWFNHAQISTKVSSSATIISLVQAIETMIPDGPGEMCHSCGRESKPSLGKAFSQFLTEFAGVSQIYGNEVRELLYDARSRLVHGDALMVSDEDLYLSSNPKHGEEMAMTFSAFESVRGALWNWLDLSTQK